MFNYLFWLIPVIIIGISFLLVVVIILKNYNKLRVIDVNAIPKERERKLKHDLVLTRLQRTKTDKLSGVGKAAQNIGKGASRVGRRAVQRLYALEQYYKKIQETQGGGSHSLQAEEVKRLINEAENHERQQEYIPAEKLYIEVISHNPKEVQAYEGLGNMYLKSGQIKQARETFAFVLRLAPDDASILMSMGELEIAESHPAAAVDYLRKAVEKRPGNPKYLDAFIETSLAAKSYSDAKFGLELMKEANKDNSKIPDWVKRLAELDPTPSKVTEEQGEQKI